MRGYQQQFCPIARASELFAERWTPIIVRNLLLGCRTFGQLLEGAPGLPRSVLTTRLNDLERHGIVVREPNPRGRGSLYRLSTSGEELKEVCDALGNWGARWLDTAPTGLDPGTVLWAVAKSMDRECLPDSRVVVRFDLGRRTKFWLLVQKPDPELCRKNPGLAEDLIVTTDPDTLAEWHMGRISMKAAKSCGRWLIDGLPRLAKAFETWGGQTPFADVQPSVKTSAP